MTNLIIYVSRHFPPACLEMQGLGGTTTPHRTSATHRSVRHHAAAAAASAARTPIESQEELIHKHVTLQPAWDTRRHFCEVSATKMNIGREILRRSNSSDTLKWITFNNKVKFQMKLLGSPTESQMCHRLNPRVAAECCCAECCAGVGATRSLTTTHGPAH